MSESKRAIAKRRIIELLSGHPEGMSLDELARRIGIPEPTVRRAKADLVDDGAELEYVEATRGWVLRSPYHSPLHAPRRDDLIALMIGRALLEPLVDDEVHERLTRLIEEMDQRVRTQSEPVQLPKDGSITRTVTMATAVDPGILRRLLDALRRRVVRIEYRAPWSGNTGYYVVEAWGLRLVDGAAYLRGYSRDHGEPRTFNVASIRGCTSLDEPPRERVPIPSEVWDAGDPAFGIDQHEPGVAVVRLRGPVARWAETFRWHSSETVEQLGDDLYERRLPYRSRREFARKLLTVLDAIVSVEPPELAAEIDGYVAAWHARSIIP
jgi:predicted DNA-binding transcriptional regulator YafY